MDHLPVAPRPDPPPRPGMLTRARAHLMDLTPLRVSRDFRRLFMGRSISEFGDEIVAVVVPFQVYQLTHSALAVGMLGLCQLIPVFVFPIVGGAFADALERRRLTTLTHTLLALLSLAMAVNASLPEPYLWPLYVFATISAGMYTFNRPALDTWPARLVEPGLLPSVSAVEAGFGTFAGLVAPVVAGVLLQYIAPAGAFVFDAATFVIAIGLFRFMRPSPPSDDTNDVSLRAILDGFRFLRGRRVIQSVFLADLNAMIFGFPIALFPAMAFRLGGEDRQAFVLGLLYAGPAAGAFLATVFSGRAREVGHQGRAILYSTFVWGAAIVLFGLSHSLVLSLAMLGVAGAGDMVSGIFRSTILRAAVEDRIRGRLDGIAMAVWATGPSLGDVESGVIATVTGSISFAVVSGGLLTMAGVLALRSLAPAFWRYDARSPTP
jgi:MFS family permease